MKICLLLSWYDESPSWLSAVVAGFGRVADELVAVDGGYAMYPGARARSYPAQAEAVMAAAEAAGIGCTIHRPRDVFWGNEVEKRQLTLSLAAPFLEPGRDWVMVADADYLPMQVDPETVRWELENTDLNVATYTLLDSKDMLGSDEHTAEMAKNRPVSTEWTYRTRDIYRWTTDLRYGPAHYTIRGTYNGVEQWIRGPELFAASQNPLGEIAPALELDASLVVYHRTQERARVRREAADGYYRIRDTMGFEVIDGVPA